MADGQDQQKRALPRRDDRVVLREYLTREELAAELAVSVSTLANWDRDKTGPSCFKVGATIVYSIKTVDRWLTDKDNAALAARERAA